MAKRKKKEPPPIPDKKITNESELRSLLANFMPDSDAHVRQVLMDGFEIVRNRIEANKMVEDIDEEDFGGYNPAPLIINENLETLDRFIHRRMGGKREGLTIKWTIGDRAWVFDPWTGELDGRIESDS